MALMSTGPSHAQRRPRTPARAPSPIQLSRSITSGPYAPYRSTLPRPSLRVHQLALPCVSSRSTQVHIDGETTPAIGPTPPRSWQGISSIAVPSASRPAASSRAASSGSRASPSSSIAPISAPRIGPLARVPVDRRPGVAELAAGQPHHLGRRPTSTRDAPAASIRADRGPLAAHPARVGEHPGQVVFGAGGRRAPVHPDVRGRLVGQRVGQRGRADRDHHGSPVSRPDSAVTTSLRSRFACHTDGVPGRLGVGQERRRAGVR